MDWIDLGAAALRYELAGTESPVLVLLHEMGGSLESWDALVPLLRPRARVLRYDARGAGLSELPPGPLRIEDLACDLVRLLDALGIMERVVVMGTAVGGAVALFAAATYPDRVCAVIATSPAVSVPDSRRAAVQARAAEIEAAGSRATIDEALDRDYPAVLRGDPALFARTRAQRLAANRAGFAATLRMLSTLDITGTLARMAVPCRLLSGMHDGSRPPENVQATAALIPGATLRVLRSGHFMALQTPELLAQEIIAFFDSIGL